jgi:hypothetical protein
MAAEQQFPYQAVVVAEQAEVRCGPGSQFYVTSMARQNEQVTVHRHDHGGWYMIAPPQGSFSWIEADCVKQTGANRGVVSIAPESGHPPRAIVRIGSRVSNERSYYGRELSNGDEVTILGEKTFSEAGHNVRMLMIAPPAQEFRWMKGELLVPRNHQIQQQIAVDPYQIPTEHRQRLAAMRPPEEPAPLPANPDPKAPTEGLQAPPVPMVNAADFDRLNEIDKRYAEMMQQEPAHWDLDSIEQAYRELAEKGTPKIRMLAEHRLGLISERQELASHYQNFVRVAAETSQRDSQLLAQRADYEAPAAMEGSDSSPGILLAPDPSTRELNASPATQPASESPAGVVPQLNGAGIVQRVSSPLGASRFVLLAPDGRLLAYLEAAEGVSLDQWIGRPAGLIGHRHKGGEGEVDQIRVQNLVPVQLAR